MASLHALLLALSLSAAPSDATLLVFHSPHCGPCQSMAPTVQQLEQSGYPVRRIDVGQQPHIAERYGVRGVPCFVMVAEGREADRVVGPTSFQRLQQMFVRVGRETPQLQATRFRGQSPDDFGRQVAMAAGPERAGPSGAGVAARAAQGAGEDLARAALHATVRLRVEDERGQSWGTGTIIDVHDDEALVVTCGHIFRDSQGKGRIQAELFAPGARGPVPGELIAYDADERDIGLVSIRLNTPVRPVRVAPEGFQSRPGDRVFSVGCNHGQDATVVHSQVTAINKYVGPANIEVAGEPVDGRSGGGLFAADGSLIGICNAADPQDKEGIYAALDTIHWQLGEVGQSRLFAANSVAASTSASPPSAVAPNATLSPPERSEPDADTEVLFILRRRDQPQGKVILLEQDRLPPQVLQQLMEAARRQESAGQPPAAPQTYDSGPVIRAQSQDNHPAYQRR